MTRLSLILPIGLLALLLALAACNAASRAPASPTAPAATPEPTESAAGPDLVTEPPPTTESAAPTKEPTPTPEFVIVPLLPYDAIPSIDDPEFLSPEVADAEYSDEELVLGVEFDGDARAYSIPFLSSHEIVNDVVAGRPIAVTW